MNSCFILLYWHPQYCVNGFTGSDGKETKSSMQNDSSSFADL